MSILDTIVALSSGAPPSGVAVIRISGPATRALLDQLAGGPPAPRLLTLRAIGLPAFPIDTGLVAWFPAPHSFTGEDCAELQLHGSPAVIRATLKLLSANLAVRLAEAGEFTRRAFENGKLDLTEVEALGDLIEAETENQRRQALARMAGGLSNRLEDWRARLLDLRAEVEAQLDFADEDDVGDLPDSFGATLAALATEIETTAGQTDRGRIVREGVRVALAGPPNAGKSSLLNALALSDVAIVTDEPGTTRDVREVQVDLGGQLVVLLDMAGLRETGSKAEAEGVRRARAEIAAAELVLWLVAPDVPDSGAPLTSAPAWRVGTKADIGPVDADLSVSSQTGTGVPELVARLSAFASQFAGGQPILVSRARDKAALDAAGLALGRAAGRLNQLELLAEDLRAASHALERLLGRMDAEAVLDRLFLSFCIGK